MAGTRELTKEEADNQPEQAAAPQKRKWYSCSRLKVFIALYLLTLCIFFSFFVEMVRGRLHREPSLPRDFWELFLPICYPEMAGSLSSVIAVTGKYPDRYWVIYQHYHGYGVAEFMKSDVLAMIPSVKKKIRALKPGEYASWLIDRLHKWEQTPQSRNLPDEEFIVYLCEQKLDRIEERYPRGYAERFRAQEKIDWYIRWHNNFWMAVVLESVFVPLLVFYVLWVCVYGYRKRYFPLFVGLIPFVWVLPHWLGYGRHWTHHPWGGILYQVIVRPFYSLIPLSRFDVDILDWIPQPFDTLSQSLRAWVPAVDSGTNLRLIGPTALILFSVGCALAAHFGKKCLAYNNSQFESEDEDKEDL